MSLLLPKTIDNTYRGQWLAIPLLALAVLAKLAMSFNAIFNTLVVIEQADKIDLDRYSIDAVALIIFLFKAWAIAHLLLALLVALALIRYRSMLALATLFMLAEQLIRMAVRWFTVLPGVQQDWQSTGVLFTRAVLVVMVLGLVLSLWKRRTA